MKRFCLSWLPMSLVPCLLVLLSGFSNHSAQAQTASGDSLTLQALNQALAALKPDAKGILIGDQMFPVERMRAYRDNLQRKAGIKSGSGGFRTNAAFDFNYSNGQPIKWTNGVVPYAFDMTNDLTHRPPNSEEQRLFEFSLRGWQKAADINFVKRTTQSDYVYVSASKSLIFDKVQPNFSWVGRSGGAQPLWLYSWDARVITHEIGHALALTHEQQRSDRDTYVDINLWACQPGTQINFIKLDGGIGALGANSDNRTPYDYDSIMHYEPYSFSMWPNKWKTIDPKNDNYDATIGSYLWFGADGTQRESSPYDDEYAEVGTYGYLSPLDRQAIAGEYGAPGLITGYITKNTGGDLQGVTLTLKGNGNVKDTVRIMSEWGENPTYSLNAGFYSFNGLPHGSYTVTPTAAGYRFSPTSQTVTVTSGGNSVASFSAILDETAPPVVTFNTPGVDTPAYKSLSGVNGTASDGLNGSGVREVALALSNNEAAYRNWSSGVFDSGTFDSVKHRKLAVGTTSWSLNSPDWPSLPDGWYQLHANAVDNSDNDSEYETRAFYIDNTTPSVTFNPLIDAQKVNDLSQIGGTVQDNLTKVTAQFQIHEDNGGTGDRYWNGVGWQSAPILLKARVDGNIWKPDVTLPTRTQMREGGYYLYVKATDAASNFQGATIRVSRTATDSTVPDLAITAPTANQLITATPSFPAISGTAGDAQTGISEIRIYLYRPKPGGGGLQSWDGFAWTDGNTPLGVDWDAVQGKWSAPPSNTVTGYSLPSGANLPNGTYQIQAYASNNETPAGTRGVGINFTLDFHQVYTWTGATLRDSDPNNNSTSWATAANWSPYGVPGFDDDAVIDTPDTITTTVSRTMRKLTFNNGTISFTNGANNTLTATKSAVWTGGGINGQWDVPTGTTLTLSGTGRKDMGDGSALHNAGTVQWQGGGAIYNYGGSGGGQATINNNSGGVFDIAGDGQIFNWTYSGSVFNNATGAKIRKSAGSGVASFTPFELKSSGLVEVGAGTLEFANTSTFNADPKFSGAGTVRFNGTITLKSAVTASCNVRLEGGTLTGAITNGTALSSYGGSGIFDWTNGTLVGTHTFKAGSTVRLSAAERKEIADGGVINNAGTIQWQGGGSIHNYGGSGAGQATIKNQNGGTFSVAADGNPFTVTYGGSLFDNQSGALLVKSGGTGTASMNNFVFANVGEVRATAGKFDFDGEVRLNNGGKFTGTGSHLKSAGSASVSGTTTITGTSLTFSNGTLTSTGTLATTSGGAFNWSGGVVAGTLNIASNSVFNINGAARKDVSDGAVINNFGTATWSEGDIYNYGGSGNGTGTFNNKSGALFNATSTGTLSVTYGGSAFNNESGATFTKSGAGTTTQFDWAFNNAGTAKSDSGILAFNAGGNSGGTFTSASAALIKFTGGTHILAAGVNANGTGKVQVDGGTVTATGNLTSGTSNLSTLEILSGTLNGTPTFTGTGTLTWKGGTIGGTFTLDSNAKMSVTGPDRKDIADGGTINNKGTTTWSGSGQIYNYGGSGNGNATINNLNGGKFDFAADGTPFILTYGGSVFNNQAGSFLKKTSGTGATVLTNFAFNSSGTILPQSGILEFAGALNINANPNIAGSGKVRLTGTTTLNSALTSSSNVRLEAGSLTGAVLESGATPATYGGNGLFDWINGSIGGTLKILSGATMSLSGDARKDINDGGVLNNAGIIRWQGGSIYNYGGSGAGKATINNLSGGKFEVAGDGQVFNATYPPSVFNNNSGAAFLKTAGSGTAEVGPWLFNNSDDIVCNSGLLNFGSDLNLKDGGVIGGIGKSRVTGGTTTLTGTTLINGTTLEFAGGVLNGSGSGATLTGGRFDWSGGEMAGTVNFAAGSSVFLTGTARKDLRDGAVLNNGGTLNWQGGQIYNYGGSGGGHGTINNLASGTFNALGGGILSVTYAPSIFNNAGLFNLSATGGALNMGWDYAQTGTGKLRSVLTNATTYGQTTTGGSVALAGTLEVQTPTSYVPASGATLKIINASSAATGTFTGLPEGATLAVNSNPFKISYAGGDGNDVVLSFAPPLLSVSNVRVVERDSGTVNAVFTVRLSAAASKTVTVNYATANGNANPATVADYMATTGTLTFAPGETSKTVTVPVKGDVLDEFDETYFLNLSVPTNAALGDAQGLGTIADNDAIPSMSIADIIVTEGTGGTKNAVFTITLSAPSGRTVGITCATADGTARTPADYTASRVNLSFASGETSKLFTVPLKTDSTDEVNEVFYALLSLPVNVGVAKARAVATITDDDASPTISISDVSIGEGQGGTRSAVFHIRLSQASGQVVKVNFATAAGTTFPATAGTDYVAAAPTTVSISAGSTVALARVVINGDVLDEENETFQVNLSTPINATIVDAQGIGTITDDDAAPSLSINDVSIAEGNSGTKNLTFTVTQSVVSAKNITVNYATTDGTARSTTDYTAKTGTLTFAAGGPLTQTVTVAITGDAIVEGDETFYVLLSSAVNLTIGKARGVGTITNDDASG